MKFLTFCMEYEEHPDEYKGIVFHWICVVTFFEIRIILICFLWFSEPLAMALKYFYFAWSTRLASSNKYLFKLIKIKI